MFTKLCYNVLDKMIIVWYGFILHSLVFILPYCVELYECVLIFNEMGGEHVS